MLLLAGDIGGTSTRLLLAETTSDGQYIHAEQVYDSQSYKSFHFIVRDFLNAHKDRYGTPRVACLAVAGPVQNQTAHITNLPWLIKADELAQVLDIEAVQLINDFAGISYGLDVLVESDFETLQEGDPQPQGVRAIIGAGTGLGIGALVWCEGRYVSLPSEGGHVEFAPRDDIDLELVKSLLKRFSRVSAETLISGIGLVHIYEFLRDSGRAAESSAIRVAMGNNDPAAVISEHALKGKDELSVMALDRFIHLYGSQAGNLALTYMATGGVYVAGGIAPKIISKLKSGAFINAFNNKQPMTSLLESIPVKVVVNEKVGLFGAAKMAECMGKHKN